MVPSDTPDHCTINAAVVKHLAALAGFDDCGIAEACRLDEEEYPLDEWLAEGYNAAMGYMQRNAAMRRDPRILVDGARSVISLLVGYKPDRCMEGSPRIAQYAYGDDYHERLHNMMNTLIASLQERYPAFYARAFVDTAPISDRQWAMHAGLGWIGRNTLLINPRIGSLCFIGELVTTAEADVYDSPLSLTSPCEKCSLCVDACPNHAIVTRGGHTLVDARRCTSYNTIENRDETLPADLDTRGYAYGCDICQLACPLNSAATPSFPLSNIRKNQLETLADSDETSFRLSTKHSAMNRIKYHQWQRNIKHLKK